MPGPWPDTDNTDYPLGILQCIVTANEEFDKQEVISAVKRLRNQQAGWFWVSLTRENLIVIE